MRLAKHARTKKGIVAPMSDDNDSNGTGNLRQSSAYPARSELRGVSFSSSRGKIWLILVANISIVTMFIFMSSTRFPSLNTESIVNDALEQHEQHPGPVNKNAEQIHSVVPVDSAVTKEPQVQDTSRPGGYSKLTSTDHPEAQDKAFNVKDATEREPEVPLSVTRGDVNGETPTMQTDISEEEFEMPLPLETQLVDAPVSNVNADPDAVSVDAEGAASVPTSTEPSTGQRSPAEIADIISRMKESQDLSSETLSPSPEHSNEVEYTTTTSATQPQPVEIKTPVIESKDFLDNLSVWLTSDSGVEVENLAACLASSGEDVVACGVNSWLNQVASSDPNAADSTAFRPASQQQKPVWIPIVPDTHNQLPTVYFTCPMVTDALRVHESMTLLFVLSPAQIETGDSYTGQKFFGNSPYGQFALHGGKPSFFASNGLVESAQELPSGQFSLVTYRLHQGYVQIKVNGGSWGGESPVEGDERRIRVTVNDVVSLGNCKGACDTNTFQGRIAEVLVYDDVLDNAKIDKVEKFLHGKWWGNKPFPKPAAPSPTVADTDLVASEAVELLEDAPLSDPVAEVVPGNVPQVTEVTQQASFTEKPLAEEIQQTSTTTENYRANNGVNDYMQTLPAKEEENATPAPKFDPRVNIFEWAAPTNADPAKAARWRSTVKEKVDYIRNFHLGGDVLRTLIRQHKDELFTLREELFG